MPFTPIPWARQSVQGRQIEADGSRLVNFYAVRSVMPEEAKVPVIIYGTPGYRKWAEVAAQTFDQGGNDVTPPAGIYGLIENNSPTYGNRLYGISAGYQFFEIEFDEDFDPVRKDSPDPVFVVKAANIHTYTAELAQRATEPVHMVTDGRFVMWVAPRAVFLWDSEANSRSGGFVTPVSPVPDVPDNDLPDEEWADCEWMDGYFILAARNGQFFHSLLADSVKFAQLDFAFASADPDEIVGIRAFARRLYVFGARTIEQWYNAGTLDFAFRRSTSFISNVGCAAKATIQANENTILFVGNTKSVYAINSQGEVRVSTESVDYDLARAKIDECRAFVYTEEGHQFYSLNVPLRAADVEGNTIKNWTLDITTGLWHERTLTGVYAAASYRDRTMFGFQDSGDLYELSLDWGDHNMQAVERRAVAPVIYANQQRLRIFSFEADLSQVAQQDLKSEGDTMYLQWRRHAGQPWVRAEAKKFGPGRFVWRRVSNTHRSRTFALVTNATRRVDLLGAYVRSDVNPWD